MAAYDITTANSALAFDTTLGQWHSCIAIDSNHFINFYQGQDTSSGYAEVYTINTSTWAITTASTRLEFNTEGGNSNSCEKIDVNHFINFCQTGVVNIFAVNTTTWAVTTSTTNLAFDTNYGYLNSCTVIDTNHFINIWSGAGASDGYIQVFTVNTTTWAVTTSNSSLEFDTQNMTGGSIAKIDANHFICSWRGGANNDGYAQVFTVNTTTWAVTTAANALLVCDTNNYSVGSRVKMIDANHAINFTFGRASSGRLYAETFTINTTTWAVTTASTPFEIQASTGGDNNSCCQIDGNHFINFWKGIDDDGFCQVVTINTSTWAVTTSAASLEFDTTQGAYNSVTKIDTSHFVNVWKGASNKGFAQVFSVAVLNAYTLALSETLTESDTLTKFRGLKKTLTETITESDTITKSQAYKKTLTDNFTVSEVAKDTVVLADSYGWINRDSGASTVASERGQSFTANGGILNSVQFYIYKVGLPTGNIVAYLYAHTGTFGVDGKPTGVALATSDGVNSAEVPETFALNTFTFSGANKIHLVDGDKYFVTLQAFGDLSNNIYMGMDASSPTATGNYAYFAGGNWIASSTTAVCFYVYTSTVLTFVSYLKSLAETFTQTEELVLSYLAKKTLELIESIGLTDTVIRTQTYLKSLIENITESESFSKIQTYLKSLAEIFSPSDTITKIGGWLKALADTFAQSDIVTVTQGYVANLLEVIDTFSISDTLTRVGTHIKNLSDTVIQSDTVTRLGSYLKSLTETFSLSDILSRVKTFILNISDSIGLTDTISSVRSWILNLSESTYITDSLTAFATYIKSLSDTFTQSDIVTRTRALISNLTESIATFDTLTKLQGFLKTLDETFAVSDSLSRLGNYIKTLTETFTESDVITSLKSVILSLSESIGLTDTITRVATYSKTFLESTSITDTLSAKAHYLKSLVETFTESELFTKLLTRFATLSESIGLTDTLTKVVTWIKNLSETTWMSEILKTSGNWWNELTKHSSTWTDGTKHSSSYTNSTKHTSSWTNRGKLQ